MTKRNLNINALYMKVLASKREFLDCLQDFKNRGYIVVLDAEYGSGKPYIRRVPCTPRDSVSFNEYSMDIYHDSIDETAEYDYDDFGRRWAFNYEDLSDALSEALDNFDEEQNKLMISQGRMLDLKVKLLHGKLTKEEQQELADLLHKLG